MKTSVIWGVGFGSVVALFLGAYLTFQVSRGAAQPERTVSPEQEIIVRDGLVSDEEYLSAAQSMVSCLRDAGLRVSDPQRGAQGLYEYRYLDGAESREALDARKGPVQGCYFQAFSEVDRIRQKSPDVQASAEELGYTIQRCVEARKVDFRFSNDRAVLIDQVRTMQGGGDPDFLECWSGAINTLFAASGVTQGGVSIAYYPLPR
jgi:hypothetical protein